MAEGRIRTSALATARQKKTGVSWLHVVFLNLASSVKTSDFSMRL
jgi:hypothetical protein